MDKPISMSVKDYLMRKMSVRTNRPLKIIEAVIEYQLQGANEALKTNNSVEISGFGKFIFNVKKAQKKYDKHLSKENIFRNLLENPSLTDIKKTSLLLKLENTLKFIESLKPKLYGNQQDGGGMEKQIDSSKGPERTDREGI